MCFNVCSYARARHSNPSHHVSHHAWQFGSPLTSSQHLHLLLRCVLLHSTGPARAPSVGSSPCADTLLPCLPPWTLHCKPWSRQAARTALSMAAAADGGGTAPAPAPAAVPAAAALHLAVRDGEILVRGFPGGALSSLLTGLNPSLAFRGGQGDSLVLGLDLGTSTRPLAQADVALGQVGGACSTAARRRQGCRPFRTHLPHPALTPGIVGLRA